MEERIGQQRQEQQHPEQGQRQAQHQEQSTDQQQLHKDQHQDQQTRQERALREYNNLYRFSNDIYHEVALVMGLSDSAFEILYCMYDLGDGCLQKDICDATYLSKQTVNSSVHKLERAGLVRLEVERGRGTHLYLTQSGRTLVNERIVPFVKREMAAFNAMLPEESEALLRLTRVYLESLREQLEQFKCERNW